MRISILLLAAVFGLLANTAAAQTVGFQALSVPVAGDKPLQIGVWYPSQAPEAPVRLGLDSQTVAVGGAISGKRHLLVVMSHGTGGWYGSHDDTARALARAGFVVAAVSHTGDTFDDNSRATRMAERPRQLSEVIDYMTRDWPGRDAVDPRRIGAFGFSSGGFTTLVAVGGEPDLALIGPHCAEHPAYYDCNLVRKSGAAAPEGPWVHDPRIRAAVVAAPALGFTFAPRGLAKVRVPIQLWRAEQDSVLPHPLYAEAVRGLLPRAPDYRVVSGADHFDFLAPCGPGLAKAAPAICGGKGFDRAAFHAGFNADVVAFFERKLR
ncbi:MAG: alpha/beta hydrolase family protein [Phenylobacterium sp.]